MDDRTAYVALNMIQGIGPVTVRAMVSAFGSPAAVLTASREDLLGVKGVGATIASLIITGRDAVRPDDELKRASATGLKITTLADEDYPARLKEIHDPPLVLYTRGEILKQDRHAIGIVGTRRATHYGRESAERLSYELAQAGFTIVSGLALGIDTAAHAGAIKAGGRTIAIVGSGLDSVYPPENKDLCDRVSKHGAVASEFPIGRQPDKTTFAIRNRIISGLSMGIVVVESDNRGGAMITAGAAADQGRTVFAVPGRIDSSGSRGPHRLIRDGARLVEGAEDILDELGMLLPSSAVRGQGAGKTEPAPGMMSPDERKVADLLELGGRDVDGLIREAGIDARNMSSLLIAMEMKKIVRMLPGRIVELRLQK